MNDSLDPLLASLRVETDSRAERAAFGLEARVLSRLRSERDLTALWIRRWFFVLGLGTAACATLLISNLNALNSAGLDAILNGNGFLFGWL
jgi:hypothetical protein